MPPLDAPGDARMRALAVDLPNSLEQGFGKGLELAVPHDERPPRLYAIGMGSSAIAADLARGIVEPETAWPLSVVRAPTLPRSVDPGAHAIFVSYSGNTWETIHAYEAAGRAGARRTVIASGGTLAERAEADGVPVLRIPPGIPARMAVGHLLGGILGLLDSAFPESNEGRMARVAQRVRSQIGAYARPTGPAGALAERIGDRLPFVCAETGFLALARHWKSQIETNAKRLAAIDEAPELFHNALAGWDALRRSEAARYAVVLLEWSGSDPAVARGFRHFERQLAARSVRVVRVPLLADDPLEALVGGIALGDFTSLFLASQLRVDPYPVEAVGRLKVVLDPPALPDRPPDDRATSPGVRLRAPAAVARVQRH